MHNLSIDLETFSSEPIAKTGLYKYVQSRDFQSYCLRTRWTMRRCRCST